MLQYGEIYKTDAMRIELDIGANTYGQQNSIDQQYPHTPAGEHYGTGQPSAAAEQEIQRISSIVSLFEKKSTERADSAEKSVKGAWILYVTAVIGGFILVI